MNSIQQINQALAQIVASLNVVAAGLVVVMTAAVGYTWGGTVGIIVGVVDTGMLIDPEMHLGTAGYRDPFSLRHGVVA